MKSRTHDVGIYRPRHRWTFSPGVQFKATTGRSLSTDVDRASAVVTTSTSLNLRGAAQDRRSRAAGWTCRPRVVSGLTPSAKALYVAGRRARRCRTASCCTSCRATRDLEQAVADVAFFVAALEGLSRRRGRARGPAVSLARSRSVSRPGAARRRDVRARPRAARASPPARRGSSSRRRRRCCRASARPARLLGASLDLKPGQDIAPTDLAELLVDAGFTREDPADEHGEFAVRGGIVDIFPAGEAQPVRLEFIGDTIESLRTLRSRRRSARSRRSTRSRSCRCGTCSPRRRSTADRGSRRATGSIARDALRLPALAQRRRDRRVRARRSRRARASSCVEQLQHSYERALGRASDAAAAARRAVRRLERDRWPRSTRRRSSRSSASTTMRRARRRGRRASGAHVRCQPARGAPRPRRRLGRRDPAARETRARRRCSSPRRRAAPSGRSSCSRNTTSSPFRSSAPRTRATPRCSSPSAACRAASGCPTPACRSTPRPTSSRRSAARPSAGASATKAFLSDLRDLKVGDLVVHVDHGIGVFVGLKQIGVGDATQEFLELRYAGDDKLFVPVERLDLVQKYTGATRPPLDRLGGTSWERAKTRVKKAMRDMAEELLKLYAARKAVPGHAFSPDSHWQQEFEDAFEYELTPDQKTAIADIKRDMESPTPMDRLLCGDVGYGKTEVAMRAAFKAVMDGKQVAFLAPTTVLAFQHQKTLQRALRRVSRCASTWSAASARKAEQKEIARRSRRRQGRHHRRHAPAAVEGRRVPRSRAAGRRRGAAVRRRPQGEDQAAAQEGRRADDERDADSADAEHVARRHPRHVDHRDAAEGSAVDSDQRRQVRSAGHRARDPQRAGARRPGVLRPQPRRVDLLDRRPDPAARAGGARRRRPRPDGRGRRSSARCSISSRSKFDVLLATTIVENGLDIPNANTIIINRADRYGLSQLYQLRGRVGRSDRPAYAYLLIPPEDNLSPVAQEAAGGDQGVQRPRQRLPRGGARPRDSRRRQPARRRAERPHRDASASRCT